MEVTVLSKISTAEKDKEEADLKVNDLKGIITEVEERAQWSQEQAKTIQKKYDALL